EFFAKHMVIVVAPGITGDPAVRTCLRARWRRRIGWRGERRVVVERAHNHTARTLHGMRGRTSPRVMQVAHFPRVAALEPILQMRKLRKLRGGSDAAEIESRCACELNGPPSEIGVRHGSILVGQAPACLVLILAAPA